MGASKSAARLQQGVLAGLLAALAALIIGMSAAPAGAAGGISGTWDCCGGGGAGAQDFIITDNGGSLSGEGVEPGGSPFAVISGHVSGTSVTIVTTYDPSFDAGYVATFIGTVSGETMSGTWTSNADQSGTWTATLVAGTGNPTNKPAAPGSSFTAVECTISIVAPDTSTCTAQVAGYSAKTPVSPTGTVSFHSSIGTVGTSCTLAPTPGSPGISSWHGLLPSLARPGTWPGAGGDRAPLGRLELQIIDRPDEHHAAVRRARRGPQPDGRD